MRADCGADQVMCGGYIGDPVAHSLVDSIFECTRTRRSGHRPSLDIAKGGQGFEPVRTCVALRAAAESIALVLANFLHTKHY